MERAALKALIMIVAIYAIYQSTQGIKDYTKARSGAAQTKTVEIGQTSPAYESARPNVDSK